MLSPDWVFDLVSAVQRFICETSDFDLALVPAAAIRFCEAIPEPPTLADHVLLRATLVDLSARWGSACHDSLRARCLTSECVLVTLAALGKSWSVSWQEPASPRSEPKAVFSEWLNAFCCEANRTHPENLAVRVAQIILSNLKNPLRVDDIAHQVGAHPSSVRRAFRREFQMSLRDYQLRARVEHAEQLLRKTPNMKIEPIGMALGWHSKKDFYRAIRQVRGCTPTALRLAVQTDAAAVSAETDTRENKLVSPTAF